MKVSELMTPDPVCCTPETTIEDVARMMRANDCGEIPVVQSAQTRRLVGVITDRDVVCRAVADGKAPATTNVSACMSTPVVTVGPDTSLEDCRTLMEEHQIRRVPVVNGNDICGIVSQADIAVKAPASATGELVREVSKH
jgi:CBS domain-containing protein